MKALLRWTRRIVWVLTVAYPVVLAAVGLLLGCVGESWWLTTVGLYLPRVVLAAPLPILSGLLVWSRSFHLLWTQAVALVVLLFPLMGAVLPTPAGGDPKAPTLRVLSYNIDSARGGIPGLMAEVDRYSPDVVLMQETSENEALAQALKARYPAVEVSGQFATAARFPVVSEADPDKLAYSGRLRSPRFLELTMETSIGRVSFYNVHPISPRDDFYALRGPAGLRREVLSGRLFRGGARWSIEQNSGLRALQVEAIADAARREQGPTVIAGDTNLPGLSPLFRRHLSSFTDGFVSAGWGFGYTYPSDRRPPWMRIDRILANGALRFSHFEVGSSPASDHRCVVADIQRRP